MVVYTINRYMTDKTDPPHTQPDVVTFAKAIADPTRQQLMQALCCNWLCASDLVEKMGLTQPTISHHMAILSDAGLLHKRREGRTVYCSLNQEMITFCCGQLMTTFAPEQVLMAADEIPVR